MFNIFVYGDSHANSNFKNLNCYNYYENSITMHRIGRDNIIIRFDNKMHNTDSIIIICYGEVDCRCHIQRQIELGREEDTIITELVNGYFNTMKNNIIVYKKIIVCAIVPPMNKSKFELVHEPITHEFPFLGTDASRIRYTRKMNKLIQQKCLEYDYIYFDPYKKYTDDEGCLNYELSDTICHIKENSFVLQELEALIH
jgi:hypothetical protein